MSVAPSAVPVTITLDVLVLFLVLDMRPCLRIVLYNLSKCHFVTLRMVMEFAQSFQLVSGGQDSNPGGMTPPTTDS